MGFLDRLLGRPPRPQEGQAVGRGSAPTWGGGSATSPTTRPGATQDERAVARYRYLLRTAPPEQLEAIHREAFEALTPEQREQVLRELSAQAPDEAGTSTQPADLARAATRAEMRRPGTLQDTFSRGSFAGAGGMGMGGLVMGSMMGTIAGVVVGSAVANALFDGYDQSPEAQEAGDTGTDAGSAGDSSDPAADAGDAGASDAGGDWGSGGGDWAGGGSDWGSGGSDIGGGDFGGF